MLKWPTFCKKVHSSENTFVLIFIQLQEFLANVHESSNKKNMAQNTESMVTIAMIFPVEWQYIHENLKTTDPLFMWLCRDSYQSRWPRRLHGVHSCGSPIHCDCTGAENLQNQNIPHHPAWLGRYLLQSELYYGRLRPPHNLAVCRPLGHHSDPTRHHTLSPNVLRSTSPPFQSSDGGRSPSAVRRSCLQRSHLKENPR